MIENNLHDDVVPYPLWICILIQGSGSFALIALLVGLVKAIW